MSTRSTGFFKTLMKKFIYALFPCGIFSFMYFYFGPTELVYTNQANMEISVLRATPYFILSFILVTLVLALAISLCSETAFDALTKLVLGLSVASYIQANLLNAGFDYLDGKTIVWYNYAAKASLNFLIWAAIIASMYIIAKLCKSHWKTVCRGISLLLLIMQGAGLIAIYANPDANKAGSDDGDQFYLSLEPQYNVSSNENVIVFILDGTSNRCLQDMTVVYEDALDDFSDFTYFQNCAPSYYGTFPEVVVMLTGNDNYDPNKSWRDFIESSWASEKSVKFYNFLAQNGYERNVFNEEYYISNKYQYIKDKYDNAIPIDKKDITYVVDAAALYSKVERLALYRYFPIALKACYWSTEADYRGIAKKSNENLNGWACIESDWYSGLKQNGLNVQEQNIFSVYHFSGAHGPYNNNEFGENIGLHQDINKQLRGSFYIVADYIQRLKDIGVYDSSTIIIMADHGTSKGASSTATASAIFMIKRRNETHEEMAISNAPITHLELIPTIAAEIDPRSTFGDNVFSIKEDTTRERTLFTWATVNDLSSAKYDSFNKFTVPASINDLNDLSTPDEVIMLKDSFY